MKNPETEFKKGLEELTQCVAYFLAAMDFAMAQSPSPARERMMGRILRELETVNVRVMFETLDMSFPEINKVKKEGQTVIELARGKSGCLTAKP